MAAQRETASVAVFRAWVWVPGQSLRPRGFFTARLLVTRSRLDVIPNRPGQVFGVPFVRYEWPAVVIEKRRFLPGGDGVLVEINGELGKVAVLERSRGQLRRALEAAAFEVIETTHFGWEAPHPVDPAELGTASARVPPCVLKR